MTTKKDLKQLIRQRMLKNNEAYTVARRHVLEAAGNLCTACGRQLSEREVQRMPDPDDHLDALTDGQVADYMMAADSEDPRDWGDWAEDVIEKFCAKCET